MHKIVDTLHQIAKAQTALKNQAELAFKNQDLLSYCELFSSADIDKINKERSSAKSGIKRNYCLILGALLGTLAYIFLFVSGIPLIKDLTQVQDVALLSVPAFIAGWYSYKLEKLNNFLELSRTLIETKRCEKLLKLVMEHRDAAEYVKAAAMSRPLYFFDYLVAHGLVLNEKNQKEAQNSAEPENRACVALHSGSF